MITVLNHKDFRVVNAAILSDFVIVLSIEMGSYSAVFHGDLSRETPTRLESFTIFLIVRAKYILHAANPTNCVALKISPILLYTGVTINLIKAEITYNSSLKSPITPQVQTSKTTQNSIYLTPW